MQVITLTQEMIDRARRKAKADGEFKHSFRHGKGNFTGRVGEEIFDNLVPSRHLETYDYDRILFDGRTVDVKGRTVGSTPTPDFDMVITVVKKELLNDLFFFTGFNELRLLGYAFGWLTTDEFQSMERIEAGSPMPQGGVYQSGGRKIYIKDLHDIDSLLLRSNITQPQAKEESPKELSQGTLFDNPQRFNL